MTDLGKGLIELEGMTITLFLISFKNKYLSVKDFFKDFPEYNSNLLDYSLDFV